MRRLVQGNEAIFLGALKGGASFFAGYPITPSSEILLLAARHAVSDPSFKFIQCEDELAAVNSIMGASLAGAKSFTATSGPGFSLMQEAVGYGHEVEIPSVIVNVQRVGPATGMPTMPAQQDVMQTKFGSHGDYYPLVFYPNSVKECYQYTAIAFNAAEESLSPVIVLSDAFLGHLNEMVDIKSIGTGRLISRKRRPLGTGKRLFTGLSHDSFGRPRTADSSAYKKMNSRVKLLHDEVAARHAYCECIDNPSSDTLIISYGIVSRVVGSLKSQFAMFRPIRIFPPLVNELRECAAKYNKIVVIEANDGQYADIAQLALNREVIRIPLLGGKINLDEIKTELSEKLARKANDV